MTPPLITGSWIDVVHVNRRDGVYWNRCTLAYAPEDWHRLIAHLRHDLGLDYLFLQNVFAENVAVYPTRLWPDHWHTARCADPVGAIVEACAAVGMRLFLGTGPAPVAADGGGSMTTFSEAIVDWQERIMSELLERYGASPALAGWYLTSEFCLRQGRLPPEMVALTRRLVEVCKRLTPALPVMASPYFEAAQYFVADIDALARAVTDSGLDIIAYQDGVGVCTAVQMKKSPDPAHDARLFQQLRQAHAKTPVQLWANTELFAFENQVWGQPLVPAPFARIRTQIEAVAPLVERVVAYTVPGIMTSQRVCPGFGAPETEELYRAYREYARLGKG